MEKEMRRLSEAIELRARTGADAELAAALFADSRGADLDALPEPLRNSMIRDQFAHFERALTGLAMPLDRIVVVDGRPCGRVVESRPQGGWWVIDIAMEAPMRGRGIGARVLAGIVAEADAAGETVSLHARNGSRAIRLYERLGFLWQDEDELEVLLRTRCGQPRQHV